MSNEENTEAAAPKAITTFGTLEKETTNQVRYSTGWGVVYVPKSQLTKLTNGTGYPENIKLTVAVQEG